MPNLLTKFKALEKFNESRFTQISHWNLVHSYLLFQAHFESLKYLGQFSSNITSNLRILKMDIM